MRGFLISHFESAQEPWRHRMRVMIEEIEKAIRARAQDDTLLRELVREMEQRKEAIERETEAIDLIKDMLPLLLGTGVSRKVDHYTVRISASRPTIRITDKSAVPPAFQSMQPDRPRILAHLKQTGEVPPGIEAGTTRPSVAIFDQNKGEVAG